MSTDVSPPPAVHHTTPPATHHPSGAGGTPRVRVLIADHDGLARRMMHTALDQTDRVVVLATARDTREALELTRYYHPDILIMDTSLPPTGCLDLIVTLTTTVPDTRIVTVSAQHDDHTALMALRAGSIGHASKDLDPHALARIALTAADGEAIIPRRLGAPILELLRDMPDTGWRPLRSRLTNREWEIVELLAHNASTDYIADQLVLSATTVYSHIKSVLRKLGVHSRHDAVTAAHQLRHEEAMGANLPISIP